jgi:hypothetical protein
MIGLGDLLLVVSHLYAVPVLVLWGLLENKNKKTSIWREYLFTAGDAFSLMIDPYSVNDVLAKGGGACAKYDPRKSSWDHGC